jgi:hypothetical protein
VSPDQKIRKNSSPPSSLLSIQVPGRLFQNDAADAKFQFRFRPEAELINGSLSESLLTAFSDAHTFKCEHSIVLIRQ